MSANDHEDNGIYRAIPVPQPLISQDLYEKALTSAEQALKLAQSIQDRNATLLEMVQAQGEAIRLRDELIKTLDAKCESKTKLIELLETTVKSQAEEISRLQATKPAYMSHWPTSHDPDPYPVSTRCGQGKQVWPTDPVTCSGAGGTSITTPPAPAGLRVGDTVACHNTDGTEREPLKVAEVSPDGVLLRDEVGGGVAKFTHEELLSSAEGGGPG